jgi:hypothetical protein
LHCDDGSPLEIERMLASCSAASLTTINRFGMRAPIPQCGTAALAGFDRRVDPHQLPGSLLDDTAGVAITASGGQQR